jgi:hypothetical protein
MNKAQGQSRKVLRSRPVIAGGLLALFFFVLAMAQFKTLHRYCHAEAESPSHQCVVTTLSSGMVDTAATFSPIVPPALVVVCERTTGTAFPPSVDYSLLPSRGPPALLA